jgi:hypothetical protein
MGPMGPASPERLGVAQTVEMVRDNYAPALNDRIKNANVQNLAPVHRGKHY